MIRLAVRCRAENAELALAQLIELAPTGIEEIRDGDIVEYALYGPPGEVPTLPDLQVAVGDDLVEVTTTEVADDWPERWKDFHGSMLITPSVGAAEPTIFLRPSWDSAEPAAGSTEIVLDPGQAFGTGSHPTTRLCLRLLLDIVAEGKNDGGLIDLGCGSGVLAIAAGKFGWDPVRAYDFDHLAVSATVENARENGVALEAVQSDVRAPEGDGIPALARTVFANIMRPQLLDVARQIPADHGMREVVLSGLLDEEADEISAAFAAHGLTETGRISEGGWTGLRLSSG
ncbi:MAG: 50S ribosomal protein L11 methyltransferase [Solirubrobacterales bacterium]